MKSVLFAFGGVSAEHEVSVVTGLQALEHLDRTLYEPHVVYIGKNGEVLYLPGVQDRKGFLAAKRLPATFGKDKDGGFIEAGIPFAKKIRPYAAYFAFHGGSGEGGAFQGLMEALSIPFTSPGQESSVITMNKCLTKEVLNEARVRTVKGTRVFGSEIRNEIHEASVRIISELSLPVIVKPAHLGSSIGIQVAKTEIELKKALLEAAAMDSEILVETFLTGFIEYNCAVRKINGRIETSAIEKPAGKDEILSFADKYERGGKKTSEGGMASLSRELPAKISPELEKEIKIAAVTAFTACRLKGMARIDFMHHAGALYLTEINSIPGSMAFYLWEASGIPFERQISELIEQAVEDARELSDRQLDYQSDIIERFVSLDKK